MIHNILVFLLLLSSAVALAEKQHGAFLGAKTTTMPEWFKESFLDLAEDITEGEAAGKRVMVFFHQDGCPYCNLLVEKNFTDPDIKSRMQKSLEVIEINMWGDREIISVNGKSFSEKQFALAKKVQFIPTLLFFDEKGKEVLRLNGYLPPDEFNLALDYIINKNDRRIDFHGFVKQNIKTSGKLTAEPDLFLPKPYNLQKLASKDKAFAVFFETANCKACKKLHKDILTDAKTYEIYQKLNLLQLDINSEETLTGFAGKITSAKQLAQNLKITFPPTIVFFSAAGKEIIRSETMFKAFHNQSIADYVASGAYKTEKEFQRYLSARADKIRESGKDVDIWR